MSVGFGFSVLARDGAARLGRIDTPHGAIDTPAFMPVGTHATVKAMSPDELVAMDAHCILGNTYHLWIRPGADLIARLGGLHRFMQWPRAILTDSGGFQVFSLAELRKIDDDGVTFKSHHDGAPKRLTPEASIAAQELLGADIAMAFDECPPLPADRAHIERAVARTIAWAKRCIDARTRDTQAVFGIVQGGTDHELRARCADALAKMPFEGFALGGLSVGEGAAETYKTVERCAPLLPSEKPRYLMGVGAPEDLVVCAGLGVDMFDCVLPTRNARNGHLLTREGRVIIKNARYREDERPIEDTCRCPTCAKYSRAYLRHLFVSGEILAMRLLTMHNLWFLAELMRDVRHAIAERRYEAFARDFLASREATCKTRQGEAQA
jgi:queuine tRNA-ribosyltransferase